MEDKFYTIEQVAEMLGLHHKTIRKFITEGKLTANKVGKQWRISGHDLSIFMENNNVNMSNRSTNKDQDSGLEFSTNERDVSSRKQKINVSTVVDINEINIDEYMRISNTLIAVMNSKDSKMSNSTINMKYYEKENTLKIMLWGDVKFSEDMLSIISILTEPKDL